MNLLTFIKKKEKSEKTPIYESQKKPHSHKHQPVVFNQVETEVEGFGKKPKNHEEEELHMETYDYDSKKHEIPVKHIKKSLMGIKARMEIELEELLMHPDDPQIWDPHLRLLSLQLFRYREVSK